MGEGPYRVSQVGVGGYGRSHLAAIAGCADRGLCSLGAVTIRPQDAEPEFEADLASRGVTIHRDFAEMLESEAGRSTLVTVPAGIPSHKPLSIAALSSGFNVLCEKPVAGTMADAGMMRRARDDAGRILAIGYQYLYSRSVQMIKSARVEGRWGALKKAKCLALWPRTTGYYARNEWAGKLELGGVKVYDSPAQNAVSHFLNTMLYLSGDRPEASARATEIYGENYRAKPIESADTQFIRATTDTGVELQFWCSHAVVADHDIVMVLTFDDAVIEFRRGGPENRFALVRNGESDPIGVEESDTEIRMRVFEDAFEAIEQGRAPLSSIDNATAHTALIETLFTRCAPVAGVDKRFVDLCTASGAGDGPSGDNYIIRGLDDLALKAFDSEQSFAELGAEWAVQGSTVSIG